MQSVEAVAGHSLRGALPILDAHMRGREYLLDAFSLADIAYAPSLALLERMQFQLAPWAALAAWSRRVRARLAWQAADTIARAPCR